MKDLIIASDKIVNGQGNFEKTNKVLIKAQKLNLSITTLEIVNLAKRWEDKLGPHQFKSGASVMGAIQSARKLLKDKKADLVLIKGEDYLRTGYAEGEREKFMKLYDGKYTPLDGYTKLVGPFMEENKIFESDFKNISHALFENYYLTWKNIHPNASLPDERWFKPLTKYFRGVDCANPNIDYSGQIILASEKTAKLLKISQKECVRVLGNSFSKLSVDGLESIPQVAKYSHLKKSITKALAESKIDFNKKFLKGEALLDAYTCYPIVPMALLIKLGLVKSLKDIPDFLKNYEVTITGGLNLAKAPWNLTSLNSLIEMREKLIHSKKVKYGLVHGNGSLGNQQGITLIGKLSK